MTIDEQARQMYRELNEGWDTKDIHEICRKHLRERERITTTWVDLQNTWEQVALARSAGLPPRGPTSQQPYQREEK
jgi:hypothetical protein